MCSLVYIHFYISVYTGITHLNAFWHIHQCMLWFVCACVHIHINICVFQQQKQGDMKSQLLTLRSLSLFSFFFLPQTHSSSHMPPHTSSTTRTTHTTPSTHTTHTTHTTRTANTTRTTRTTHTTHTTHTTRTTRTTHNAQKRSTHTTHNKQHRVMYAVACDVCCGSIQSSCAYFMYVSVSYMHTSHIFMYRRMKKKCMYSEVISMQCEVFFV